MLRIATYGEGVDSQMLLGFLWKSAEYVHIGQAPGVRYQMSF